LALVTRSGRGQGQKPGAETWGQRGWELYARRGGEAGGSGIPKVAYRR